MNETSIFYPQEAASGTYWLIGITIACIAVLVYAIFYKKQILSMIMGLSVLILAGSTVFSWISTQQTSEVIISSNSIETMYGKIAFSDISKVYIEETVQSEMDKQLQKARNRYLVIEKRGSGYPTALPDGVFQVDSIKMTLDMKYRSWREKQ